MTFKLTGGRIFTGGVFVKEDLYLEGDRILQIGGSAPFDASEDVSGSRIVPGFIDTHIHGGLGVDFVQGMPALEKLSRTFPAQGLTGYLPTITGPHNEMKKAVADVRTAMKMDLGSRVLGAHVEGPFLNPKRKGALNAGSLETPDLDSLVDLIGRGEGVAKMTVAPELPGAEKIIRYLAAHGVIASIGHTVATSEIAEKSIAWGVTHATHLFNAMEPMHHRKGGVLPVVLSRPEVVCELVSDLIHVEPAMIQLALHCKKGRINVVTDAMEATGQPDGDYVLSGQKVLVRDGIARLEAGNLASSTLTMDQALRNLVQKMGLPLESVLPLLSEVPADLLGRRDLGRIRPGALADLLVLDDKLTLRSTYVGARKVFER
ncbi:N-acetylglucosamine-6-phosphate deacetylase [Gehongia tenuis]|uniref:N-acetylglucosamine-6-phosphate deacetylase n=1 Tax=Gehongia tenuis TaxID=2763655 RepID=A0A926HR99_9FIRM|nr:N-acetylglucosamine-6-phosphate deacetylase [Gehongia tenuis]MBC8532086.1 N-acetylglucosamine-6-phosphate deacetylase [Gehongia tenuis]